MDRAARAGHGQEVQARHFAESGRGFRRAMQAHDVLGVELLGHLGAAQGPVGGPLAERIVGIAQVSAEAPAEDGRVFGVELASDRVSCG